jgi:energy-coupling factor transporter ATP-binding protein EcfA2
MPNEWVGLSKISTGQRSALALSVFLALNLRTTGGPRLLLIDDPVAHVDDLNTLSFLDFLREIVIQSKRQLFFTTASRKMASLFEMKFSDIEGFPLKKHKLSR